MAAGFVKKRHTPQECHQAREEQNMKKITPLHTVGVHESVTQFLKSCILFLCERIKAADSSEERGTHNLFNGHLVHGF